MSQTVIGTFDSPSEANEAVENLINKGFNREDIELVQNNATSESNEPVENIDSGNGISHFFKNLFNDDENSSGSESGKRGTIISVYTQSDDEAERAADILDECGAVDIDEKDSEFRTNPVSSTDRNLKNLSDMDADQTAGRSIPTDFNNSQDAASQESEEIKSRSNFKNQNIVWNHDEDETSHNSNQSRNF